MHNYYSQAGLADERRKTLLAEAAAGRLARQVRQGRQGRQARQDRRPGGGLLGHQSRWTAGGRGSCCATGHEY